LGVQGRGGIVHFDIEKSQFGRVVMPTVAVHGTLFLVVPSAIRALRIGIRVRIVAIRVPRM
jgi:glyoxylate carboligase